MQLVCYLILVYYVCSVVSMFSFWNDQLLPPLVQSCYELLLSPFVYPIWAFEELRVMSSSDRSATILIHIFMILFFVVIGAISLG